MISMDSIGVIILQYPPDTKSDPLIGVSAHPHQPNIFGTIYSDEMISSCIPPTCVDVYLGNPVASYTQGSV